jgi:hypothetical protein
MSQSRSIATAMNKERRKELAELKRAEKAAVSTALKAITALRKEADKIDRAYRKASASRTRRIAILEGRIG